MSKTDATPPPERAAILRWTAGMGAITAEALADRQCSPVASARARLLAAGRAGLLTHQRPLVGQPALYTITRKGVRACGVRGLDPCRVTASNALHAIVCATVAVALERCYPDHRVVGERELRREERDRGAVLASVRLDGGASGRTLLHRPDLVLWPDGSGGHLPVPVEVELTTKAPTRLAEICRAWARCRLVAGVLYLVAPDVERALDRAIDTAQARGRIAAVPLAALPSAHERAVPSAT